MRPFKPAISVGLHDVGLQDKALWTVKCKPH